MDTNDLERLRAFRHAMYTTFGCRRDALAELRDARLAAPAIEHPVHLSLAPGFQRRWGSLYDALNAGTLPLPRLEHLVAEHPLETTTAWYAVDASVWPRCDAETSGSPGRLTSFHSSVPRSAQRSFLELLLAGTGPRAVLQLDGASARASHPTGRKRHSRSG